MPAVQFYCVLCGSALQTSSDSRYDLTKCPCCSRYVPVPRPVNLTGDFSRYQPVLPPEVLGLSVKFQCTTCGVVIAADARCEGRQLRCDDCGAKTTVPRWSNVASWRFSEAGQIARLRAARPPVRVEPPTLSVDEIDFLRGTESRKPEAAA
ncbi:MAG: hypothetical protein ABJF10_24365 [Chthoniobacter sp.]|uniref:hypothetical protein n=1 Tax=Chthoniobacter sp. TaxID=2510640 RepID=UPI0032A3C409